jgi:hypothetical protein
MASLAKQLRQWFGGAQPAPPVELPRYPKANSPVESVFSFVVDIPPHFAYQGYHLARSLFEHGVSNPADVYAQLTPEVDEKTADMFRRLGCTVCRIQRFGDGKFHNKLSQLDNLLDCPRPRIVLIDTDSIVVTDLRPYFGPEAMIGKPVGYANPDIDTLKSIAISAGLKEMPPVVSTDAGEAPTYRGYFNGGLFCIPRQYVATIRTRWREWSLWLRENVKTRRGEADVDQIAMWLTLHLEKIPLQPCSSNLNYFVHRNDKHLYYDPELPICNLHYHRTVKAGGLIEPAVKMEGAVADAVARANAQMQRYNADVEPARAAAWRRP